MRDIKALSVAEWGQRLQYGGQGLPHKYQRWSRDLFELSGITYMYLLLVDYFSWYPEVVKLTSTTSEAVITAMKSIFSRHGIPEVVRSDNGSQYLSHVFQQFAKVCNFQHLTSSPWLPQSNGRSVQNEQSRLSNTCSRGHLTGTWLFRFTVPLPCPGATSVWLNCWWGDVCGNSCNRLTLYYSHSVVIFLSFTSLTRPSWRDKNTLMTGGTEFVKWMLSLMRQMFGSSQDLT